MKKSALRILSLFTAMILTVVCLGSIPSVADSTQTIKKSVTYDDQGNAVLSMSTNDPAHYITYTADGTAPTSDLPPVRGPVTFFSSINIRAAEFDSDGKWISGIKFTVSPKCISPVFEVDKQPGTTTVRISCATPDSKIYYTLDGTAPSVSSSVYSVAITLTKKTTLKAVAMKDGFKKSAVEKQTITVLPAEKTSDEDSTDNGSFSDTDDDDNDNDDNDDDDKDYDDDENDIEKLTEEKFVQKGSKMLSSVIYNDDGRIVIILNKTNQNSTIRYTINGKNPTKSSPEYTKAFTIHGSRIVKAYEYGTNGSIISSVRMLVQGKCAKVEISTKTIMNGLRLLTMDCNTPDVDIYFTIDGSAPTEGLSLKYDGNPVPVRDTDKVSAIAYKEGWIKSNIAKDYAAFFPLYLDDFKYNNSQNMQVLELLNEYRLSKGLSELTLDKDLCAAAYYQTKFCFRETVYSEMIVPNDFDASLRKYGLKTPSRKTGYSFSYVNSAKALFNAIDKNATMHSSLVSTEIKRVGIAFDEAFGKKSWVIYFTS